MITVWNWKKGEGSKLFKNCLFLFSTTNRTYEDLRLINILSKELKTGNYFLKNFLIVLKNPVKKWRILKNTVVCKTNDLILLEIWAMVLLLLVIIAKPFINNAFDFR